MNSKTIAVLSGLFLVLAGFYYFYEVRWTAGEKEAATASKKIMPIDREKVNHISMKNRNGEIVLEKEGNDWLLAEPIKAPADTWAVERIIDTLASGNWERELTPLPDDLADFGLDKPEIEVVLSIEGHPEHEKVFIGEENPAGDMRYMRVGQEDRVLMVYAHVKDALDKTPDDLRDKRILLFSGDAVARLEWQVDKERFSAEKKEKGWVLIEPAAETIEEGKIKSLIWRLEDLQFEKIFEEPEHPLSYYGLNEPYGHVKLWEEGTKVIGALSFGKRRESSVSYYIKAEGENAVYELSYDFAKDLPRSEDRKKEQEDEPKP